MEEGVKVSVLLALVDAEVWNAKKSDAVPQEYK